MRRTLPLVLAAAALASLPTTAQAESKTCFGAKPNVVGTAKNDVIRLSADEAGTSGTINGKPFTLDSSDPVISTGAGNDRIEFSGDPGFAVVCAGKGDDVITGSHVARVSAGPGHDRVQQFLECDYVHPDFYDVEEVRITGFDSTETGPCN